MIQTYGTSINGVHTDTSNTLKGAKRYASINGLQNVTKRTGYNSFVVFNKVGNKWISTNVDDKVTIYSNEGKTFDEITIVLKGTLKGGFYNCIGSSYNGIGFFMHSTCQKGKHLGKKIKFNDLDRHLRNILTDYFDVDNY